MTGELSKPQAVVFDNDGLLLDTEPCWTAAEEALFKACDHLFDLTAKRALVGTSPQTSAPILEKLLDQPGAGRQLSDQLYARALTEIANGATPRPGAVELVGRLQAHGVPLAVASNSPRSHLLAGLRRVGLQAHFAVILGVDDVTKPKPAPDLYLAACHRLGVAPERAVALEDSNPGVTAAKAAGMRVIGIPSVAGVVLTADLVAASLADPAVHRALGVHS
ncbi:MAG TPA: HAD family phosphatase [Streptosporangiaceae bacterium]|nr:HAD family phosphatase [Streptosporangiaceae bacterium]